MKKNEFPILLKASDEDSLSAPFPPPYSPAHPKHQMEVNTRVYNSFEFCRNRETLQHNICKDSDESKSDALMTHASTFTETAMCNKKKFSALTL
jgi:hypothetical protein